MDKYLKPEKFSVQYNESNAANQWRHWKRTFEAFLTEIDVSNKKGSEDTKVLQDSNKLALLFSHVSCSVYEIISECKTYYDAMNKLDLLYDKPKNEIYVRHCLLKRIQHDNESVDQYIQELHTLSKDCTFKAVTAEKYREEYIRDAFINGLNSNFIRQRLLENISLTLDEALTKARSLESAAVYSQAYSPISDQIPHTAQTNLDQSKAENKMTVSDENLQQSAATKGKTLQSKCYFCGNQRHPRSECPAKEAICKNCRKTGHYAKVCRSSQLNKTWENRVATLQHKSNDSLDYPNNSSEHFSLPSISSESESSTLAASPNCLSKSVVKMKINGFSADGLIDTGSSESYISDRFAAQCSFQRFPTNSKVSMASSSHVTPITSFCKVKVQLNNNSYSNVKLNVLPDSCADIILGHDVLNQHSGLHISFGGSKPTLEICAVACANIEPVSLFEHLNPNCRPIAVKSRRYSIEDEKFIATEIEQMLKDGIIEESKSPWRAQPLVVQGTHRKRLVIDFSQTINRYTFLDAYPVPSIEKVVSEVAKYDTHSTIDLKSAYFQIPIKPEDKPYTAFEANGKLWQFCRIPMGVTNGVAGFQRTIDGIIKKENLKGVHVYLDDITVSGNGQDEHDRNLDNFLRVCKKYNLTINMEKSSFRNKSIKLLGYSIENHTLRPDPDRLEPLMNLPVPEDIKSLKRVLGMFSYYSKWVPKFSDKIHRLIHCKEFPMGKELIEDFEDIKRCIQKSVVINVEDDVPFCVETDASEFAISAILTQNQRPVAFFSRTLSKSEMHHSSVEKEAYAIVEALRKWRHYLVGKRFKLITDQKSVSFMFNTKHAGKIKNEKIVRWRLELSSYNYEIIYRPGKQNDVADTLSRICSSTHSLEALVSLHNNLCHPGVTRMAHWVKSQNLPYTLEEVRNITSSCKICAELKPRFFRKNNNNNLIMATAPFQRLSLDFKGPIPSETRNKYLLTLVDEYSRYPFAIPCANLSTATVIESLTEVFAMFGCPSYIHTDRGMSFMSEELRAFLTSKGIAISHTTSYNPCGNGQIERYNGIIWKTISLALKTRNLQISQWERVLRDALHSIRSLLCTATNTTPHERMFTHRRRSATGVALPPWLTSPGTVLMKKHVRQSKYDPLVEEVYLIHANPDYALVRLKDGRETNVNLRHLAPTGENFIAEDQSDFSAEDDHGQEQIMSETQEEQHPSSRSAIQSDPQNISYGDIYIENPPTSTRNDEPSTPQLRRSSRIRHTPQRFKDYVRK
jgi:predicted aspartyl protease